MQQITIQGYTLEQLKEFFAGIVKDELTSFKKELNTKNENDELMSKEQVLDFLQINASTLHRWTIKGRINVYKFSNKCYYKRSELLQNITLLKK